VDKNVVRITAHAEERKEEKDKRRYQHDTDIIELFKDVVKSDKDFIGATLDKDTVRSVEEAYQSIYRKIRPGDLATAENAKSLIDALFFDFKKYDMGNIARYNVAKENRWGWDQNNRATTLIFIDFPLAQRLGQTDQMVNEYQVRGGWRSIMENLSNEQRQKFMDYFSGGKWPFDGEQAPIYKPQT
jgi:hypothetical protein